MEKKRAGSDRRSQSAVMYLVMAFSFCIFIWLFGTAKAPDVRFDSEKPVVITGDWSMEYQGETAVSQLPGPFSPQKGIPVRYSIMLGEYGTRGNSVMVRAVHQYVRIFLDGEMIEEFGYGQKTPFGEAPYNAWVIARLPDDCQGKTLSIEIENYYSGLSGQLNQVYIGTKNALVFQIIHECMPTMIFNFAIILAALLLLAYSFSFKKQYVTYQLRCLCLFSLVTCMWLVLESGGYQILWGRAPLVSNMLFLLFYLIPPTCIRFILTYDSFSKDKWLNLLYWLSCINVVVVSVLQIAGIRDFIESLMGAHVLLILIMAELLFQFIWRILHGDKVRDIQLMAACLSFAVFACLDIVRFYVCSSEISSAYFSQIGVVIFFCILVYYAVRQIVEEREEGVKRELLERMAYTDLLTGLPNRNAFEKRMEALRGSGISGTMVVVADLNDLKRINDQRGHQKGDAALIFVADALKASFQDKEELYRIGGDEFCALSGRITGEELEDFAASLQKKLEEGETKLGFPVSVAVGWSWEDECGIDLAFRRADFTMYEKKQQMKREREQDETRLEPSECGCGGIKNETE